MKFTVIIPTRDRAITLEWALKTCTSQDYDNLEIIVSDNASRDHTAEVVRAVSDPRVRYLQTGASLGMAQNWEFALSHVTDGFVFFMGDDDGLLPGAVERASQLLQEHRVEALAWDKANYGWPNNVIEEHRNVLSMPIRRGLERRNGEAVLSRVCRFDRAYGERCYRQLPGVYNSFMSKAVIDRARSPGGRFFCSQIPDVYSAIAVARSVGDYLYSRRPFSIGGSSGYSIGAAYLSGKDPKEVERVLTEESISFHADLLPAPSIPIILTECVWQVRDNVPRCSDLDVDLAEMVHEAHRQARKLPPETRERITASLEHLRSVRPLEGRPAGPAKSVQRAWRGFLWRLDRFLFLYQRRFSTDQLRDIYGASQQCGKLAGQDEVSLVATSILYKLGRGLVRLFKPYRAWT